VKIITTIVVCIAVYVAFLFGATWLGYSERNTLTQEAYERCLAKEAQDDFARCMSGKLDVNLALGGWANRREYCLAGIGIAKEMARLYGVCPQPKNSN
jgi:hypothetical protein